MSPLFRRGRRHDAVAAETTEPQSAAEAVPLGPVGDDEPAPALARVDLGCLRVPVVDGAQLQLEVDRESGTARSASVVIGPSRVKLSAFAAPRSAGVWDEVREEITAEVTKVGGTAREVEGTFGAEVLATIPVRTPDGRQALQVQRYAGIDGRRWFVRAVFAGPEVVRAAGLQLAEGADDPERLARLEEIVRGCVVVRGSQARPPREPLPMTLPAQPQQPGQPVAEPSDRADDPSGV